jgi:hypothetical protein
LDYQSDKVIYVFIDDDDDNIDHIPVPSDAIVDRSKYGLGGDVIVVVV